MPVPILIVDVARPRDMAFKSPSLPMPSVVHSRKKPACSARFASSCCTGVGAQPAYTTLSSICLPSRYLEVSLYTVRIGGGRGTAAHVATMSGWSTHRWARLACRYPGSAWAPTGSAIRGGAARHGLCPSTKASRSSARPSRPGSTSSTRPMGTPPEHSEEILGRALREFAKRDDVVIATKVWARVRPGPNGSGLSRKAILAEVDHSLARLGCDYIDLYQIHGGIRPRRSKRPWRRCTTSCAAARSATSGHHRWPRGNSRRLSTRHTCTAGPPSCRCRITSTCCTGRRSGRCSRSASTKASASFPGARSRAAS